METAMYHAGKLLVRFVFGCVAYIRVIGRENANCAGGFLLAANHISHFDPFLIGLTVRRKIDWMTMAEFFRSPALGFFLRSIDAFSAERDRADLKTIRTAIDRLKSGRVVGIFPEGGIRDGARSLLEGAPLRPGAATLAQIADVPIVPCVILGTDRFYSKNQWLPFRRTPVWIAFGKPISCFPELKKSQARERIESELAVAFKNLYAELRENFCLTTDDLPQSPQERMSSSCHPERSGGSPGQHSKVSPRDSSTSLRSARNDRLQWATANVVDSLLCASINWLHRRHGLNGYSRQEMERYLTACEPLSPQEYYVLPQAIGSNGASDSKPTVNGLRDSRMATLSWRSPIETAFAANNTASIFSELVHANGPKRRQCSCCMH
jgi:1-acyl-sn-glycerol-3-phosphate acyltransferase